MKFVRRNPESDWLDSECGKFHIQRKRRGKNGRYYYIAWAKISITGAAQRRLSFVAKCFDPHDAQEACLNWCLRWGLVPKSETLRTHFGDGY